MDINVLRDRVNEKRKGLELPKLSRQRFLRIISIMQNNGQLIITNGEVILVVQYPTMIYRSPKG